MKMTKEEKIAEAKNQIDVMLADVRDCMHQQVEKIAASGAMPDEYLEIGSFLLAKSAFYCMCKNNPYAPHSEVTEKQFNNIYTCS